MKNLYKFTLDCGRSGTIEGVFSASSQEITELVGKTINFDEVLGKHSYISTEVSPDVIKLLSEDQEKIEWFDTAIGTIGHNPFDYVYAEDDFEAELD